MRLSHKEFYVRYKPVLRCLNRFQSSAALASQATALDRDILLSLGIHATRRQRTGGVAGHGDGVIPTASNSSDGVAGASAVATTADGLIASHRSSSIKRVLQDPHLTKEQCNLILNMVQQQQQLVAEAHESSKLTFQIGNTKVFMTQSLYVF